MKYQKSTMFFGLLALVGTVAVEAATVTYKVSSTEKINCTGSPHGLWTNKYQKGGGNCQQYYDFQSGSTLVVDDVTRTARLQATAKNPAGILAEIDFFFTDLNDHATWTGNGGAVKNGGSGSPINWDFFGSGEGTIIFSGNDMVKLGLVPNTALQVGDGANDKTPAFGASAWLTPEYWTSNGIQQNYLYSLGNHWDLNMELTAVPLPAAVWLFISALVGLAGFKRAKSRSNT